jgi:hypothetical protein
VAFCLFRLRLRSPRFLADLAEDPPAFWRIYFVVPGKIKWGWNDVALPNSLQPMSLLPNSLTAYSLIAFFLPAFP